MSSKRRRAAGDDGDTERGMKPYSQFASSALDRAGELEGRMRHLNDKYFEWVKEQHSSAPAALWTTAAKEYCQYVEELLEEFSATVDALQDAEGGTAGADAPQRKEQGGSAGKPPVFPRTGNNGSSAAASQPAASAAPSSSFSFGTPRDEAGKENTSGTGGGAFGTGAFSFSGTASSAAATTPAMPLFGASPSGGGDGASSGSLFGAVGATRSAAAKASSGSIFGASSSALFGASGGPAAEERGAAFGSGSAASGAVADKAPASQPGAFGSLGKGSLFGGPIASGGLFASSPASGGSLFGTSSAPSGGKPFSAATLGSGSGASLFAPGGAGGSLFGSSGAATGGAASSAAFGGSLFGGQASGGAFAGLGESSAPSADAGAAAEEDAEEEQAAPVALKGSSDTEILFEGKAKASFREENASWTGGAVGTLTVRKNKASGTHWLQINNDQGRILLYLGVPSGKAGRVTVRDVPAKDGPPRNTSHTLSLQKFAAAPEAGEPTPAMEPKVTNIRTITAKAAELQKALESAGFTVGKVE